jgi:hypothetical protein
MKPNDIIDHAATLFDIDRETITSRSKTRAVAAVRAAIIWAIEQRYPHLSMLSIVKLLNLRDRKSAYHAIERCERYMRSDPIYAIKAKILAGIVAPRSAQQCSAPQKLAGSPDRWAIYNATQKGSARVLSA